MGKSKKRETIIQAAQEVISEIGFGECTIAEIAKRANVFDSVIYRHFKNKEDLLFYCVKDLLERVYDEVMLHFSGIMGAGAKLSKLVWFHLHLNDHKSGRTRMFKNLLFECRSNPKFYVHEAYQALRKYTGLLFPILQEGVESSLFRNDFKLSVARDMIFGVIDQESINCLLSHEVEQTIPDFESVMSLILAMIQKGPEAAVSINGNDKAVRIIDSATRLFSTKGYVKTTMLEIANDAKIAEGTLYEYFKTKDELIYSISADRFKKEKDRLERFFESDDPLTKLQRLIQYHLTRFFLSASYPAVFFDNILKLQKNFYTSRAFDHFLDYISILDKILEDGKRKGVFRQNINNRVYRNLYFGAFSHLTVRWFLLGKTTPQDIIEEFSQAETLLCRAVSRPMDFNGAFVIP